MIKLCFKYKRSNQQQPKKIKPMKIHAARYMLGVLESLFLYVFLYKYLNFVKL